MKKLLITAAALGLTVGFVATASATNGYFGHGYSLKNKGMAGAGVAVPTDAMGVSTNPATLTEVGNRLDLGLSIFSPSREYNVDIAPSGFGSLAQGTVESDSNYFPIPNIGWSKQINENSAWGIAAYGNGGMNTDYPPVNGSGTFGVPGADTGVDLMQLFIAPTYAHKFAKKHSFGITPIIGVQFFEARGLDSFGSSFGCPPASPSGFCVSTDDTKLTNNGHDSSYGFGGRIGYLGQITDQFSIGLAYQTKIYMDEFDDYAGLYAEQGDFDIPANWTVGVAFMPTPAWTLAFDVQQIYFSDINAIANPMIPNIGLPGAEAGLGPDDGAGFGWDDMTIIKLGLQWARTEQWTYRFGYSYGEQPIPDSETMFNILAPATIEQHATFGLTYTFENQGELDFSLMYAFENDVAGPNPFDPTQTITLTMSQWEFGFGYSWKF